MARDLGRLGESAFVKLCNEVGLKCNKSDIDHTGWDYVLELPNDLNDCISAEKNYSKTIYRFQVKTSDSKLVQHPVKLSNLSRFVNDPVPSFFIFFEFDKTNNPVRCFLRHVGIDIISTTIERLRKSDIQNEKALHKKHVKLGYSLDDEILPMSGEELRRKILHFVGNDSFEYAANKRSLVNKVGFDERPIKITLKKNNEEIEQVVDAAIGLRNSFFIKELIITETRFNLDKIISIEKDVEVNFSPMPSKEKINFICIDNLGFEVGKISASMFIPPYSLVADNNYKKIRFKTNHLDILFNLDTKVTDVKFLIGNDEVIDICTSKNEINFFFMCIEKKHIKIEREDSTIITLELNNYKIEDLEEIKPTHDILNRAFTILKKNNIVSCFSTIRNLLKQELSIMLYSNALTPISGLAISSKLIGEGVLNSDLSKTVMVFTFKLDFGDWFLAMSVSFSGINSLNNKDSFEVIVIDNPVAIDCFVKKKRSQFLIDELIILENNIKNICEEKDLDMVLSQKRVTE